MYRVPHSGNPASERITSSQDSPNVHECVKYLLIQVLDQ